MPKPTCSRCRKARSTTDDGLCNKCRAESAHPRRSLPLGVIRLDGETQIRISLPEHRVEEYAEALAEGVEFPPIVVFHDGSNYWMGDGFTRWHAHGRAGREEILCEVRPGTRRDAILYACGANATHGEPRTNKDKRNAVTRLLDDPEWGELGDERIAQLAGVTRSLVWRMRKERAGEPWVRPGDRKAEEASGEGERLGGALPDAVNEESDQCGGDGPTDSADTVSQPVEEAVLDLVGLPIDDPAMRERFAILEKAGLARKLLRQAQALVNEICQGPGGEHLAVEVGAKLDGDQVYYRDRHIVHAVESLAQHMPYCSVCPYCHVVGKVSKSCKVCRGYGYLTKLQWQQCPEDLRSAVEREYGTSIPAASEDGQ